MHVFNESLQDIMKPKLSIVCGQIDALTFVSGFLSSKIETTLLFVDIQKRKKNVWDSKRTRRQEDSVTMKNTKSEKWVPVEEKEDSVEKCWH